MSGTCHDRYMALAIELAKATHLQATPNPSVGAVIVKNNQILGLGSHLFTGFAHAEIYALQMAGSKARGATLYITLEPCNHHGKTPPCTEAIIAAGIKQVVVATLDPNPLTNGNGIKKLKDSGIEVLTGILHKEAQALNPVFNHYITQKLPYITLKAAMSLDGKLATTTGQSKWISDEQSRVDSHQYRHEYAAILVGVGTIISDNPALTTRLTHGGKNPLRIVLDSTLHTPLTAQVITDEKSPTWIISNSTVSDEQIRQFTPFPQVKIFRQKINNQQNINLRELMQDLAQKEIASLLVEGGAKVYASFLQEKLVNQLVCYMSPRLIGGQSAPSLFMGTGFAELSSALKLEFTEVTRLGSDLKIVGIAK